VEVKLNSIKFEGKDASLVIARDITEQINHLEAIESQNEQLRKIAYIQSHYVRAPLARIMGLVDLIAKGVNEKSDPELLSYLDQSANDLDDIIKRITNNTEQLKIIRMAG
jgi:light-regulated signal transduction histidine kinase (bacteriophytochrome)